MTDSERMVVTLRLFAVARSVAGNDSIQLDLPTGATIAQLRSALLARLPELEPMTMALRFAVNEDYASEDTVVCAEDDLACIPPVSGG